MSRGYPTVRMRGLLTRRRVTLYEDYLASEMIGSLGITDIDHQVFYDEIHYVFRYRKRDWGYTVYLVLAALVAILGLAITAIGETEALWTGFSIAGVGAAWGAYLLFRMIRKRLLAVVVSPRGSVDFWVDRPRSRNPMKDAPKFLETLLSRVQVVETAEPAPAVAPAPEPVPAAGLPPPPDPAPPPADAAPAPPAPAMPSISEPPPLPPPPPPPP
jgi:hypothetical protein